VKIDIGKFYENLLRISRSCQNRSKL